ncbi:hypothetical protein BHAMNSH16_07985 [Brachyspira hampsonii]|uniref:Uncharacterized protein n=1 Tax=Brachyspira hampsonii TaxID=1287055 RepID=A0AAC9TTM5_9SPIR|nr:hypothetical protein [Brachyspira hampsonii]ASJ21586.1 hypothetical protein BHAMNSH16_07985 [Brachyspira hampsonii]MBW5409152.1 hypothetical protein [Brachyspira hampsonii]OEJ16545.1 hypothetical protein A9496_13190 [Brachyspira hampsonii]PTY39487.1 hypothetical protein DQ06_02325 [Brachyspira hampsonii bv. II]
MTALCVRNLGEMPTEDIAYRKDPYSSIDLKLDIEIAAKKLNIKKPFSVNDTFVIADYINNNMED